MQTANHRWDTVSSKFSRYRDTLLAYVIGLLTICTAMFLSAFYNALVNWQIRTRRLGTVLEFLRTEESWWPS